MMRLLIFYIVCLLPVWGMSQTAMDSHIYFDTDESYLTATALHTLDSLLPVLENKNITLVGHTDSRAGNIYNLQLGLARANAVKEYLTSHSIKNITVKSAGETEPLAENNTPEHMALNRRVTITYQAGVPIRVEEEKKANYIIRGLVTDGSSGQPLAASVSWKIGSTQPVNYQTPESGKFEILLENPRVVEISATAPGYVFSSKMVETGDFPAKGGVISVEIPLQPLKKGNKVVLNNIYFVGNETTPLPQSAGEFQRLYQLMADNPTLKIKINGHINYPLQQLRNGMEVPEWSVQLSINRAKKVHDYLIDKGIDQGRLQYEGFSNTQMVYPYAVTEEEQRANRRVEFEIVDL